MKIHQASSTKRNPRILPLFLALILLFASCGVSETAANTAAAFASVTASAEASDSSVVTYISVNNGQPDFPEADKKAESFEYYSDLDSLGRCGPAYACIGQDLMPTEERGAIGMIKPSGWQTVKYDIVEGKYLYNRCHLIGFQLAGENANEKNLITGTRWLNVEGMLPFENMVADYVKETNNHVLYRVTPDFQGNNLVASGVEMEAWSVEDEGDGICFDVYVYNIQPGIEIDYATGESHLSAEGKQTEKETESSTSQTAGTAAGEDANSSADTEKTEQTYILNTNTMKFHLPSCSGAADIKEKNRQEFTGLRSTLIAEGYSPCGRCKP